MTSTRVMWTFLSLRAATRTMPHRTPAAIGPTPHVRCGALRSLTAACNAADVPVFGVLMVPATKAAALERLADTATLERPAKAGACS